MGLTDNIVATSYVEETNFLMLHEAPLGDINYCVAVAIAFNNNAPLPLPNEDFGASLIGHLIGLYQSVY